MQLLLNLAAPRQTSSSSPPYFSLLSSRMIPIPLHVAAIFFFTMMLQLAMLYNITVDPLPSCAAVDFSFLAVASLPLPRPPILP
jgi:hypothetical protein